MIRYVIRFEEVTQELFCDGYEMWWEAERVCRILGNDDMKSYIKNNRVERPYFKAITYAEEKVILINEYGIFRLVELSEREVAKDFWEFVRTARAALNKLLYWTAYKAGYMKGFDKGHKSGRKRLHYASTLEAEKVKLDKVISSKYLEKVLEEIMFFIDLDLVESTKKENQSRIKRRSTINRKRSTNNDIYVV